jgi:hypothetical protein
VRRRRGRFAALSAAFLLALAVAGAAPGSHAADPRAPRLLVAAGGKLFVATPRAQAGRIANRGFEAWASWSHDGTLLLASSSRAGLGSTPGRLALVTQNPDGSGIRPLTGEPGGGEVEGRWSPGGGRVVFTRRDGAGSGDLELADVATGAVHTVVATDANERQPAWAPNGRYLTYVSDAAGTDDVWLHSFRTGHDGAITSGASSETQPVFSPTGAAIAYVDDANGTDDLVLQMLSDGTRRQLTADPGNETAPVWSPDGSEVGFVSVDPEGTRALKAVRVSDGRERVLAAAPAHASGFDWRIVRTGQELLPDMAQRLPANLVVTTWRGRFRLGFDSTVANVGRGPLEVHGTRHPGVLTMHAAQLVDLAGGGSRAYRDIGFMRYFTSAEHNHWHFLTYERYELRRPDGTVLVRDHKAGFCFRDNLARRVARHLPGEPVAPVFTESCRKNEPGALAVTTGSSVGSLDWYPAFFHGQFVDVTAVPAGVYDLVHHVNVQFALRESDYGNDAASLRIRLSWPRGRTSPPAVAVLRRCPLRDRC